jgi:hypothetical protein
MTAEIAVRDDIGTALKDGVMNAGVMNASIDVDSKVITVAMRASNLIVIVNGQ